MAWSEKIFTRVWHVIFSRLVVPFWSMRSLRQLGS